MTKPEDAKFHDSQQPIVRFRQLCKVSLGQLFREPTLLALSEEGVVYRHECDELGDKGIWRRLPTVTSTQLEVRLCTYPGCDRFLESIPGATDSNTRCALHVWRPSQ